MYVDGVTGMRVAVLRVAGPLCSASVVVPTEPACGDARGLPHCLEHLVFLGTATEPRGFLDTFAERCLTPGTNAITAEDRTEYTVTGAGAAGVCRVLPHLLAHVFAPALSPEGLLTEVHHYDAARRASGGVVFSEIAGRENARADLCEAAVYRCAYPGSGYAADCGGRTEGIVRVALRDVAAFHARYYRPAEATLLVVANADARPVLDAVAAAFPRGAGWEARATQSSGAWDAPLPPLTEDVSEVVKFPADDYCCGDGDDDDDEEDDEEEEGDEDEEEDDDEDENDSIEEEEDEGSDDYEEEENEQEHEEETQIGGVTLAWRGPSFDDTEEIAALMVLARFFSETAASPLMAKFTQTVPPLANDADLAVVPFKEALIELSFDGVPHFWTPRADGTAAEPPTHDLFAPGTVKGLVLDFFRAMAARGYLGETRETMREVARRHYVKFLEDMEDEPHNVLNDLLVPLFTHRRAGLAPADLDRALGVGAAYRALAERPPEYWVGVLERWVLRRPCVEVVAVPDAALAGALAERAAARTAEAARLAAAIPDYDEMLARARAQSEKEDSDDDGDGNKSAEKEEEEMVARLPEVPSLDTVTPHCCETRFVRPADDARACVPTQLVSMRATQFAQVRVCVDVRALAPALQPLLALFQDLFLVSPVRAADGRGVVPHFDVVRAMTSDLVTVCCDFGFASANFGAGYLMDMFHVWAVAEPARADRLLAWTQRLLQRLVFTREGVLTETCNLLAALTDTARDPAAVCDAAAALVLAQGRGARTPSAVANNLLLQRRVLLHARAHPDAAVAALDALRRHLLAAFCDPARAFVQIFASPDLTPVLAQNFWDLWRPEVLRHREEEEEQKEEQQKQQEQHKEQKQQQNEKRKKQHQKEQQKEQQQKSTEDTFFATPEFCKLVARIPEGDVCTLVPVAGCESASVRQAVVCDVAKRDADYFPLLVMCAVLSRSEGPLFARVRGPGLAYDAAVSFALWDRLLCLALYECTAPAAALAAFRAVLAATARDPAATFTPLVVDTARSALLYEFYSDRASVPLLSSAALRSPFKGFPRLADEDAFEQHLARVDPAAVVRVFRTHCLQFLEPDRRTTVVSLPPHDVPRLRAVLARPPHAHTVRVVHPADFAKEFPLPLFDVDQGEGDCGKGNHKH